MSETNQAVYLSSVSVANLACFGPRQTLDLTVADGQPARWTLILGDNGTGKTTLLQAIAGLTPVAKGNQSSPWIVNWPPAFSLMRGQSKDALTIMATFLIGPRLHAQSVARKGFAASIAIDPPGSPSDFIVRNAGRYQQINNFLCYGYGATRRPGAARLGWRELLEFESATLFDDQEQLISPGEWLLRMDYAAAKQAAGDDSEYGARKERVKKLLIRILPDVEAVDIQIHDGPGAEVFFKTAYGKVPFERMGLGYRTMTAWVIDLAARMFRCWPDAEDPLSEPAVVLVDEIDLHLHPSWQRHLMGWLSELFPNTQFVATAHSPLMVQAAQDARIAVLKREGDHAVVDQSFSSVTGWRVDQLLTSDLFGLPTARAARYDEIIAERTALLSKSALSDADERRVIELDAHMAALPAGENAVDIEAMDIIRRAADALKRGGDG